MSYIQCATVNDFLVILCLVYISVCRDVDTSSNQGFGGKSRGLCNSTTDCDSDSFICRHLEGCTSGECVCKPGMLFNLSSSTCDTAMPPAGVHQPCTHIYGCKPGLVCKYCEYGADLSSQRVCRRASYPMEGDAKGNLTYGSRCNATADCASTLYCYKSEDCDVGMCMCQPGMEFVWPEKPCIAIVYPSVKDSKLGETCRLVHEKSNCVDNLTCTICPGEHLQLTCTGQPIKYTTETTTKHPEPDQSSRWHTNGAIYAIIPVVVLVVCVVVVAVIVKQRRIHQARFADTWTGLANPLT